MSAVRGIGNIRQMAVCAMMTALLCVLCPLSVPIGPVPVSLGVFAVYLVSFVLEVPYAVLSCALYLLLGILGLPVFAGYSAGPARIMGPTGGYLAGYLLLALSTSFFAAKSLHASSGGAPVSARRVGMQLFGMTAGLFLLYLFGTVWYSIYAKTPFAAALAVCVYPFLVFDALKIAAALFAGNALYAALSRAHLLHG